MYFSTILISILFTCSSLLTGIFAAKSICDSTTAVEFVEIPEDNHDRNYTSIDSDGKRPLGFDKGIVYYNQPTMESTCVKITGANGKGVEVLFETVPSMKLCVKDQTGNVLRCGEGRHFECKPALSNTMIFEFSCPVSEGCSESDILFWYRITKGPVPADDPEGMWCGWRDTEYPGDLATLPPDFKPPTTPVNDINSAAMPNISKLLAISVTMLALMSQP